MSIYDTYLDEIAEVEKSYRDKLNNYDLPCKPILGFPNYIIYRNGRVYNGNSGRKRAWLKHTDGDKNGYYRVDLQYKNGRKTVKLHRLLAIAFIPNPENKSFVDHVDRNVRNNNLNNLRWATHEENQINSPPNRGSPSKYKGVYPINSNEWDAIVRIIGSSIYIGRKKDEKDAALMYDDFVWKKYGYFAYLNFPRLISDYVKKEIIPDIPFDYKLKDINKSIYLTCLYSLYKLNNEIIEEIEYTDEDIADIELELAEL